MHCVEEIKNGIYWVGCNDFRTELFERIFPLPQGVTYNTYFFDDEKTCLIDAMDKSCRDEFLEDVEYLLKGRKLDYFVIQHMEPDHASSALALLEKYPEAKIVGQPSTFKLFEQFFRHPMPDRYMTVNEGDQLKLGKHTLQFIKAPMVHWPEVIMTYDVTDHVLFSADAFGHFGTVGNVFADQADFEENYLDEARRYYVNIVGKYGPQVMNVLKKASKLPIDVICPLHGPVWRDDFPYLLDKYQRWSTYTPEEKGVLIAYSSMYGNTEAAAQNLASKLCEKGVTNIRVCDVSSTHVSELISQTFKLSHLVLASVTYNLGIYPVMLDFLEHMKALHVQKRTIALIENGSWAVKSGDLMQEFIDNNLADMTILNERLSLASAMHDDKAVELEHLADALVESINNTDVK